MDSMLASFIEESRANIETANECFLKLEQNPGDAEVMDELSLTPDHIDILLAATDQVGMWIDELEENKELPVDAAGTASLLSNKLKQCLNAVEISAPSATSSPSASSSLSAPSAMSSTSPTASEQTAELNAASAALDLDPAWYNAIPDFRFTGLNIDDAMTAFVRFVENGFSLYYVNYQPDAQCFFSGEDPFALVSQCPQILAHSIPRHYSATIGTNYQSTRYTK